VIPFCCPFDTFIGVCELVDDAWLQLRDCQSCLNVSVGFISSHKLPCLLWLYFICLYPPPLYTGLFSPNSNTSSPRQRNRLCVKSSLFRRPAPRRLNTMITDSALCSMDCWKWKPPLRIFKKQFDCSRRSMQITQVNMNCVFSSAYLTSLNLHMCSEKFLLLCTPDHPILVFKTFPFHCDRRVG